jgi:hypothetical protein
VPNRRSPKTGWISPLLRVLESCFSGLKGPWIARVLERLAIEHKEIAQEFIALAFRFSIISFYERDELVATNRTVSTPLWTRKIPSILISQTLSKNCATLGVPQEEPIPIPDQSQLMYLRPPVFDHMNKIINTCVLRMFPSALVNLSILI